MTAFLITWKADKWPHHNLVRMLGEFVKVGTVTEEWLIAAHTKAYRGARVWLIKQGPGERGIFGCGRIEGPVSHKDVFGDHKLRKVAPVKFEKFVDPLKEFLIRETYVRDILDDNKMYTQSSGITLTDAESTGLFKLL